MERGRVASIRRMDNPTMIHPHKPIPISGLSKAERQYKNIQTKSNTTKDRK
jgi:hypothetical protein